MLKKFLPELKIVGGVLLLVAAMLFPFVVGAVAWGSWSRSPEVYELPNWQLPFDKAAWLEAKDVGNFRTMRSRMVDQLRASHDFSGWTRAQVVELLGDPKKPQDMGSYDGRNSIVYYIGLERSGMFSLDDELLVFLLDSQDRVVRAFKSVN